MRAPPFILGTHYFRPPFPRQRHWADDFHRMRDAGLNAVQFWLVWGWCEPKPGVYRFDDYDRLAELAAKHDLKLILSVLPEINPFWIERVQPDAMMVDVEGRLVHSGNRGECIAGIVPGVCSDHPEARRRMQDFLRECGAHFGNCEHLLAWDVWNENRWRNQAPDLVCFCEHSIAAFHQYLRSKCHTLEGLGQAWQRRLCDWRDVRVGRLAGHSYPEMSDFTGWMCHRAREMIQWRIAALREGDPKHLIGSHTGNPTIFGGVNLNENIFSRGIDWDIAQGDIYGYSSFPKAVHLKAMDAVDFAVRTSACMTAGRNRRIWMSELQGGATAAANQFGPAVSGAEQQAWVWTGISRGAEGVVLWCWRPEVFGKESNGYGFTGFDGQAEDRLRWMRQTAAVVAEHGPALAAYRPDPAEVAVLFQRDSYFHSWMSANSNRGGHRAVERFLAWPRALECLNVHYEVHDDRHLDLIGRQVKLVIVPYALALDDRAAEWLIAFARSGGTVLVEGPAGAHGADTFFRDPGERPLYRAIGVTERLHRLPTLAQRSLPAGVLGNAEPLPLWLDEAECTYDPAGAGVVGLQPDGLPMAAKVAVGDGWVVLLGSAVGAATHEQSPAALEALVEAIVGVTGVQRSVHLRTVRGFASARLGRGGKSRLLIVTNFDGGERLRIELLGTGLGGKPIAWFGHALEAREIAGGVQVDLVMQPWDRAVVEWPQ